MRYEFKIYVTQCARNFQQIIGMTDGQTVLTFSRGAIKHLLVDRTSIDSIPRALRAGTPPNVDQILLGSEEESM